MSRPPPIHGITAPQPRLTPLGAAGLALVIAVPCGIVVGLITWIAAIV